MTTTTGLHYLTLHELSLHIRAREVSPVDATEAVLERIERLNPQLNAYITVTAERARADARAAAAEIAAGTYRGPLHGVPVAVKDLCATKGVRTTAASKILADWLPLEDATVVRKLREAGAVIVGKLNLHEYAFGATGLSSHFGPARNPWNTDYITGGSSSGSGAAVAAGLCYAAIGSDTGGSIRIPASLCGVSGLKPTYGRVSLSGAVPLSWSLDHLGPLGRTARDCALVLQAIAGYDANDPCSANVAVEDWAAALDAPARAAPRIDEFVPRLGPIEAVRSAPSGSLAGLRVGVPANAFEGADPEVMRIVRAAIDTLGRLGAQVREIALPQLQEYWGAASVILLAEAAAYHKANIEQRPQDYSDDVRARLRLGLDQKAASYIGALRVLDDARRTCDQTLLPDVDVLAMPTTLLTSVPIATVQSDDPTLGLTRLTAQFDLTGQPAMSVPCGLSERGLPVGLQIVGKRFDERTVLRIAHAFEMEAGMMTAHPPVD